MAFPRRECRTVPTEPALLAGTRRWAALTGSVLSTAATRGADGTPVGSRWEGLASTAPIRRGLPPPIVQVPGALATAQGRALATAQGKSPSEQALFAGDVHQTRSPTHAQLDHDVVQVELHRGLTDEQLLPDDPVGQALSDQPGDFPLTFGQTMSVRRNSGQRPRSMTSALRLS